MHVKYTTVLGFCLFSFLKYDDSLNKQTIQKVMPRTSPEFLLDPHGPWAAVPRRLHPAQGSSPFQALRGPFILDPGPEKVP